MHSGVLGEFALFAERLATLPAGEGSLSTVHTLVDLQQATQAEALATLQAREGHLPLVHPAVAGELGPGREALVTGRAKEWPLSGRAAREDTLHAPHRVAALLKRQAWAWPLSRVHTAEPGLLTEGPVALSREDWPRPAALALVSLYAGLWEKAHVTSGALGRALPPVQKVVAEKGPLVMEAYVTLRALQWALPCVRGQRSKQIPL